MLTELQRQRAAHVELRKKFASLPVKITRSDKAIFVPIHRIIKKIISTADVDATYYAPTPPQRTEVVWLAAEQPYPYLTDIIDAVCKYFRVSRMDLDSRRKYKGIATPRLLYYYLAKAMTPRSLPEIARELDGRDHTTVLSGIKKINRELPSYAAHIEELKSVLLATLQTRNAKKVQGVEILGA